MIEKLYNPKVSGNTIVEVLVALTISTFCTALAVVIYLNVQKSSLPFFKVKAVELAEYYITKTISDRSFTDEVFDNEAFTIKKTVAIHERLNDCYVVRVVVFDAAKKRITELERVAYAER